MQTKILAAFAAALMLSACGGGGGGSSSGGPSQPVDNTAPIVAAIGGTPLSLSSAQIKAELRPILSSADTFLATDIHFIGGGRYTAVTCQGAACSVQGSNFYISDFDLEGATYEAVMTRHGVMVAQGTGSSSVGEGTETYLLYGGWLEHSAFVVEADIYEEGGETRGGIAYGTFFGDATGSVPVAGSATWRGVMVAAEVVREEAHQGDATLTANFAVSNIDVAFTNIREVDTGAARASIMFDDVPMTRDGFTSRAQGRIEGKFYGPSHAEAGGIFERGNTIGAFGAKRQ